MPIRLYTIISPTKIPGDRVCSYCLIEMLRADPLHCGEHIEEANKGECTHCGEGSKE